jgi:ABC-type multidrug transport system fused ATPase/permease subunit
MRPNATPPAAHEVVYDGLLNAPNAAFRRLSMLFILFGVSYAGISALVIVGMRVLVNSASANWLYWVAGVLFLAASSAYVVLSRTRFSSRPRYAARIGYRLNRKLQDQVVRQRAAEPRIWLIVAFVVGILVTLVSAFLTVYAQVIHQIDPVVSITVTLFGALLAIPSAALGTQAAIEKGFREAYLK